LSVGVLHPAFDAINLVVGIWFLVELGFLRGTDGPNK
jgi:hypothetical protein